jgi:hypothetical protein
MSSPRRARLAVLLAACVALSPWDDAPRPDLPGAVSSSSSSPSSSSSSSSPPLSRLFAEALHDGNDTVVFVGVTVDADGNPVGDTTTPPGRSMVGFVQDCAGFPPRQSGTLCGARGAYLSGHYLYVAATQVDAVTVVDLYRPDMPTVAGSVSDPVRLKGVVQTWVHRSGEYVVAVARGRRPAGVGHVALVDVRYHAWYQDPSRRFLVKPRVISALRDCVPAEDGSGRSVGRLCGSRGVHVVHDVAYVASEMSNTLATVALPPTISRDFQGIEPATVEPEFIGSVVDERLEGAYAVAVDATYRVAYVASRWCRSCVVLVDVRDDANPKIGGLLPRLGQPGQFDTVVSLEEAEAAATVGRLRGVEFVARGVRPDAAFAFVTTEFDGRVSAVAAECARVSVEMGESVQYCAMGARRGLYDLDSPPDEQYWYRANARPNAAGG